MYDYKFRQSDLSFKRPNRPWYKTFLLAASLALAAGAIFAIVEVVIPWQGGSKTHETDSDIIPLPLPPHPDAKETP